MGNPQEYRVLSVRQPWAKLIVTGVKNIENRSWETAYRGTVLIHASSRVCADVPGVSKWLIEEFGLDAYTPAYIKQLPTGGIVGSVELVDCVEEHESDWFEGDYGFVLARARQLPFRAMLGKLGLFKMEAKAFRELHA